VNERKWCSIGFDESHVPLPVVTVTLQAENGMLSVPKNPMNTPAAAPPSIE
jgi:hypothetical protein